MAAPLLNGIIKSVTPLPAMIFSFILERKRYPFTKVAAVVGMCAAAVMAVPFGDDNNASPFGLALACTSMVASATRQFQLVVPAKISNYAVSKV